MSLNLNKTCERQQKHYTQNIVEFSCFAGVSKGEILRKAKTYIRVETRQYCAIDIESKREKEREKKIE